MKLLIAIGVLLAGIIMFVLKKYKIGPWLPIDNEITDFFQPNYYSLYDPIKEVIHTPPEAPIRPVQHTSLSTSTKPPIMDFSTQKAAFHSTRVLCDELGANPEQKDDICAMVYQESRFLKGAIGKPNKNGTIDYGIAQFNNGTLRGVPLWIGKGAAFASTQEVLNNPEKCIRLMIKTCLAGHWSWWVSYGPTGNGPYKQWLPKSSPMWELAK